MARNHSDRHNERQPEHVEMRCGPAAWLRLRARDAVSTDTAAFPAESEASRDLGGPTAVHERSLPGATIVVLHARCAHPRVPRDALGGLAVGSSTGEAPPSTSATAAGASADGAGCSDCVTSALGASSGEPPAGASAATAATPGSATAVGSVPLRSQTRRAQAVSATSAPLLKVDVAVAPESPGMLSDTPVAAASATEPLAGGEIPEAEVLEVGSSQEAAHTQHRARDLVADAAAARASSCDVPAPCRPEGPSSVRLSWSEFLLYGVVAPSASALLVAISIRPPAPRWTSGSVPPYVTSAWAATSASTSVLSPATPLRLTVAPTSPSAAAPPSIRASALLPASAPPSSSIALPRLLRTATPASIFALWTSASP
eukprot:CAMPEP_0177571754 /NCGR_PEP_ID=MMETSP0369-20130122/77609_1 /TAXON_ID=447022 ORGANISM="Scrippsiella hangoei-like, Strain SHHI-4" /NCGR_SAMPLE_ID=MMETSP0369 /ASSEMBLY_ACC=CAM_ASM_000364 /LENGTH=372 /DNA_ID=CAMNT_0019059713 /DNA_START=76 /DNA_END=1191 /DNA_ORIENTATION=-